MKALFAVLGAIGIVLFTYYSGWEQIASDFRKVGWLIIPLCLTFLPTAFLYGVGWWLVTPRLKSLPVLESARFFFIGSLLGVAWNNLTPFAKVGGEVVRVLYLSKKIPRPQAIASVLTYNLTHLVGAFFSFVVAAFLFLWVWQVPESTRLWVGLGGAASFFASVICVSIPLSLKKLQKRGFTRRLLKKSKGGVLTLYALKQNQRFFQKYTFRWITAVIVEVVARFIEGLTFYFIFLKLGTHVDIFKSFAYDVARTFADTLFFFVPYSLGSRELFLNVLMQEVYLLPVTLAISSSLIYRLIEIIWTALGYWLWLHQMPRSSKKLT